MLGLDLLAEAGFDPVYGVMAAEACYPAGDRKIPWRRPSYL
jgi:hypothetical protein